MLPRRVQSVLCVIRHKTACFVKGRIGRLKPDLCQQDHIHFRFCQLFQNCLQLVRNRYCLL